MLFNKLIEWYGRFPVLLLLVDAASCKNKMASTNTDLMLKKQAQKHSSLSNATAIDQQDNVIPSEGNSENPKHHAVQIAESHLHEISKDYSKQTHQVDAQPSFTLKNITTKAGMQQSTMLEATGITEGYSIKSISIVKNGTYHTNKFGVKPLQNKPIPSSGLPIALATDPRLQAGSYLLNIKIGKTGKGSRQTEQSVTCNIHVIKDEIKNNKQNESSHAAQTIEVFNSEAIPQNDCPSKDKTDTAKNIEEHPKQNHTTPAEPSFTLKDVTIQAGTQQSTMLEIAGITKGYSIKSISISQNRSYYTNKFGVDVLKNKPIPFSGLPVTLTPDLTLEAGSYKLKIRVGKTGQGSQQAKQWVECTIHVIKDEKIILW